MAFSKEWDKVYQHGAQDSIWPWSDLVSYVMRYSRPTDKTFRVLELGCGAGANIPFFASLGVEYFGIEGSATVVGRLRERYPAMQDRIVAGDFTQEVPFDTEFDLVVDRSSLTHNTTTDIMRCLGIIHDKLKPMGTFIGIDWFSTSHPDYLKGIRVGDDFTRSGYQDGRFSDVGQVHFSDEPHLRDLFLHFEFLTLEHKTVQRHIPPDGESFASWNFAVKKTTEGTA
jgi:SAM-dependent methyltransferase